MSTTLPHAPVAVPPAPETLEGSGLSAEMVTDLLLKTLYNLGARTGQQLAEDICLGFSIIDDLLVDQQERRVIEVKGTNGVGRSGYLFTLSGAGRERARDAFEASQYVGPAPVPLAQYRTWVERQSIQHVHVNRDRVREGFAGLVLEEDLLETLGPAVNSAKSLFIFGESGNGKTMIAEAIAAMLGGAIYVPHAIEVEGRVIVIHDPVYHQPAEVEDEEGSFGSLLWRNDAEHDRRFARVKRPVVVTGGELMLEQLDLQYDPHTKMYQAPFQMKANGGVLIIDDFGRQRVRARDLLNRWIVPLEKRLDYLTLHTGGKFPVPFDALLLLATNLDPDDLVEEAFLRRIHYKIYVDSPRREQYTEIFRRCCASRGIAFEEDAFDYLWKDCYETRGIPPRGCHPRDILDHVVDAARYSDVEPSLSPELLDYAVRTYFITPTATPNGAAS
jgi:predicted ATPase with chaperone activity